MERKSKKLQAQAGKNTLEKDGLCGAKLPKGARCIKKKQKEPPSDHCWMHMTPEETVARLNFRQPRACHAKIRCPLARKFGPLKDRIEKYRANYLVVMGFITRGERLPYLFPGLRQLIWKFVKCDDGCGYGCSTKSSSCCYCRENTKEVKNFKEVRGGTIHILELWADRCGKCHRNVTTYTGNCYDWTKISTLSWFEEHPDTF